MTLCDGDAGVVSHVDLERVFLRVLTAAQLALERFDGRMSTHVHAQRVHALALVLAHLACKRLLSDVAVVVVLGERVYSEDMECTMRTRNTESGQHGIYNEDNITCTTRTTWYILLKQL